MNSERASAARVRLPRAVLVASCCLAACAGGDHVSLGRNRVQANDGTEPGASAGSAAPSEFGNGAAGAASAQPVDPGLPPMVAPGGMPAGTFQPRADLDPNVQFEWEATLPGQGTCQAGTYTGTFECDFVMMGAAPGDEPLMVTGPLSIALERSMDGEFLEIADGDLAALAFGVFGIRATIEGKLDCSTFQLDARAVDGVWAFGDPQDISIPGGTFSGPMPGELDPATLVINGTWGFDTEIGSCKGPWTVSYTP